MAVLKCNATGHGAAVLGRHLQARLGARHLAVATLIEAVQLRDAGVHVPILVFGNSLPHEMGTYVSRDITPAVATPQAVTALAQQVKQQTEEGPACAGRVHIALDTGMHRNGCQPDQLPGLVQLCRDLGVHIAGIYSHFAHYEDAAFTQEQTNLFHNTVHQYRQEGIPVHLAHAGGLLHNLGTHYDYVRPGITLYGLPPSVQDEERVRRLGFRPILSVHVVASLVKRCAKGSKVGYSCTYTCSDDETIVTLPIGFGDGYRKALANRGAVLHAASGSLCAVVGGISMDAVTVRAPDGVTVSVGDEFVVMTADFHPQTSVSAVAKLLDTNPQEVCCSLSLRLPRIYTSNDKVVHITTPPGVSLDEVTGIHDEDADMP